jgi:hypothetical protein
MALKSDKHPCVTLALIAFMPKVFESVQDRCITKANCKKDSKLFYVSTQQFYILFSFFWARYNIYFGADQVLFQLPAMLLFEHGRLSGGKGDWLEAKTFACPQRKSSLCRKT